MYIRITVMPGRLLPLRIALPYPLCHKHVVSVRHPSLAARRSRTMNPTIGRSAPEDAGYVRARRIAATGGDEGATAGLGCELRGGGRAAGGISRAAAGDYPHG